MSNYQWLDENKQVWIEVYKFLGKTITEFEIDSDKQHATMKYIKDGKTGTISLECKGDCCAYAWIEDVTGLENLIDATILNVEAKYLSGERDSDSDVSDSGFYTFHTSKGYFDIELRVSHNGYYGGHINVEVKEDV